MQKVFLNWSGGKDCSLALHRLRQQNYNVEFLFTTLAKDTKRVSMHGVSKELITRQAMSLGIHSRKMYLPASNDLELYNKLMRHEMQLMQARGLNTAAFGDIFLEDLKKYREEQLHAIGMQTVFPLWKEDPKKLILELIDSSFKAIVVCVNAKKLDASFLGRTIDRGFISDLPAGVDVCGENGEFHTFVYDGPGFATPIRFTKGETVLKHYPSADGSHDSDFYFLDLQHL
jgi:uncharacterized protein (TIGR00290 family)